ncbi:MAG: SDR family oxidoreductase [Chloroflexota bacterium]|nr:SDR family oxidoreductase [Chloroflexota bacterium]
MQIDSSVALITGGGRGLGQAFARALAEHGASVAIIGRTESEIRVTAQEIERAGGRAIAIPGDVTNRQAVERAVAITEAELGPIDLLVNNAGMLRAIGVVAQIDADDWWREIEVNLRGSFLYAKAVLTGMIARRRGRIINIASGAGLQAIAAGSAYCVSKAALIRLSENIALETGADGISTFAIHPGTVRTPMNAYLHDSDEVGRSAPELQQWFRQLYAEGSDTPIERPVKLVLTLASGRADALSGCFLDVNDDIDALVTQAEAIQREERLHMRLCN